MSATLTTEAPGAPVTAPKTEAARRRMPHALVLMLGIIVAAAALTWVTPSGEFSRSPAGLVVPGSYRVVPKDYAAALSLRSPKAVGVAVPAKPVAIVSSIPAGMTRSAALIVMILFIGGMFGVLQESGALEAGIERLLTLTRGNPVAVVSVLMIGLAAGSTFLGLISEYLVVIPMSLLLSQRLGYDALFGTALVTIAAKIGYLTSVTNPLALAVAQPLVGVPVFSGAVFRAVLFAAFLPIGIWYLFSRTRGERVSPAAAAPAPAQVSLTGRQRLVLLVLLAAIVAMVFGVKSFAWGSSELAAMYVALAIAIAVAGGVQSRAASQAFIRGMQGMVLAALLVGLAAAVEVILRDALVLDTIVEFLTRAVKNQPPVIVANLMMLIQMAIDVFIPSTSGKAAVTMPILGPIGQLSGVSGQVTVLAFLFGNGLMNTLTPTSGMLLAYLATGQVSYSRWIRFILPLALALLGLCAISLAAAVFLRV